MTDLIEVKTADLAGEALGWAIGKAEGLDLQLAPPGYNGVPWRVFARYGGYFTLLDLVTLETIPPMPEKLSLD